MSRRTIVGFGNPVARCRWRTELTRCRLSSCSRWIARRTDFSDWEAGAGFRMTESTLLKASYRGDKWVVTPANAAFIHAVGRAIAVQLSQSFDVMDLVTRRIQ